MSRARPSISSSSTDSIEQIRWVVGYPGNGFRSQRTLVLATLALAVDADIVESQAPHAPSDGRHGIELAIERSHAATAASPA